MDPADAEVHAAGGVVWRQGESGPEFALVHRPKYDDWSIPKGKLEPGESFEEAALREVREETGLSCELGRFLGETMYRDRRDRPKLVRYWEMTGCEGEFRSHSEIDDLIWVPLADVESRLDYPFDRELVAKVAEAARG